MSRRTSLGLIVLTLGAALAACDGTTSESDDHDHAATSSDAEAATQDANETVTPDAGSEPAVSAQAGQAGSTPDTAGTSDEAGSAGADSSGSAGMGGAMEDASMASSALPDAVRDSLLFTREEEKLARDVYTQLLRREPVFENIARSEQIHMDAIAALLTRYSLRDPAEGAAVGEFENDQLRALYQRLTEEGGVSTPAALAVGLEIEELDIHDITKARAAISQADILRVYDNLTRGSRNHLRAFYARLSALGGSYTPKYLEQSNFMEIATSATERGP